MPYKIDSKGCPDGKFGVINSDTGESKGCSDTEEMAKKHMSALYANEKKELEFVEVLNDAENFIKSLETSDVIEDEYDVSYTWEMNGATSFSELDAAMNAGDLGEDMMKLTTVFKDLLDNIFNTPVIPDQQPLDTNAAVKKLTAEFSDRVTALLDDYQSNQTPTATAKALVKSLFSKEAAFQTRNGKKFGAGDFFYVPDAKKPSTWKLLKTGTPGGEPDKVHVSQALSALGPNPIHGNKAKVTGVESVRAKVMAAWHKLNPGKEPASTKKETSMMVWKDAKTGQYRWLGTYSNNFLDKEKETIAEKSHIRFEEMVDKGLAEYPVLMHWHLPEFTWGKSDMVTYDSDSGMAIASGYILPGHEAEAELATKSKSKICMSHGMIKSSIARAENDSSVIIEHVTQEVSDLPAWAAANELTSFSIVDVEQNVKEASNMTIPDAKKKYLIERGLTEEMIDAVLTANKSVSDEAVSAGVTTKETDVFTEPVVETVTVTPVVEVTPATDTEKPTDQVATTDAKEVAAVMAEALAPLMVAIKSLQDKVVELETKAKENADKELTVKDVDLTPAMSLGAMIAQKMSSVGNKETFVPGNTTLAKDKPAEETPIDKTVTGDPMLDLVGRITSGKSIGG